MAEFKSDGELLRDYVDCRSEKAFADLVERHTNLVFATASRGVADLIAAQEVTQNVFIALARKAAGLRRENTVTAWLHKATLLEMSADLPVVIEIVDAEERIPLLLPHLEEMVQEGMITMEHVAVLMYRHERRPES